jgi:hypothetical protein
MSCRQLLVITATLLLCFATKTALSENTVDTTGLELVTVTSAYHDPATGRLLINETEWFTPSHECAAEAETYPSVTETKFWMYVLLCFGLVCFAGLMVRTLSQFSF